MKTVYIIDYDLILNSTTLYGKQIKVKNKSNELLAKVSLEDYLKQKYGDDFQRLVITNCKEDLFSSLFSGFGQW